MGSDQLKAKRAITDSNARGPSTFHHTHMHNISINDNNGFSIKQAGQSNRTKRISAVPQKKLNSRKANLGMGYGKSVHGILSAAVPAELYKQIINTAREEKINISDLVRRGVMREIGAIRFSRALGLDPAVYGVASHVEKPKPVEKPKADKPKVDRLTKVEARKAIRDLRKALKRLAN